MTLNPNITPSDIAANMQPPTNIRIAETPAVTPTTPVTPAPATQPADYKKYKDIYNAFQPVQNFQQQQTTAVNDRYAKNAADITTLFGTLTTLREQDKVKIQEQFVNTLVAQQNMLAGRTAETRAQTTAGNEAANKAASELGGAPTGAITSQTNAAAERGIAQSNAISTIWQNQMASQNLNTQAAIQNQIAGYEGQGAILTKDLGVKRDAQLMQLQAQQTDIDQKLAQAKTDYDLAVKNNNAAAARDAANRANTYAIAKMKNTNQTTSYSNDLIGWNKRVADMGGNPAQYSDDVDSAYSVAKKGMPKDINTGAPKEPTNAAILRILKSMKNPDGTKKYNAEEIAVMNLYLDYTQ